MSGAEFNRSPTPDEIDTALLAHIRSLGDPGEVVPNRTLSLWNFLTERYRQPTKSQTWRVDSIRRLARAGHVRRLNTRGSLEIL